MNKTKTKIYHETILTEEKWNEIASLAAKMEMP